MDLGLVGKAVLVTGGSQGIGRGVAEEFAREGARVAICARGKKGLDEAREALEAHGAEVIAITADMSQADDAERVGEAATGGFGRLDAVGTNTGGGALGHTREPDEAEGAAC